MFGFGKKSKGSRSGKKYYKGDRVRKMSSHSRKIDPKRSGKRYEKWEK